MKKILIDGKEVITLVPDSLPMLIHGEEGSGASLYTVCLAAKWFTQGYKVLFLCGYPMAEKAFSQQVGTDYKNVTFYTKEHADQFIQSLKLSSDNTIVIVKNVELFGNNVYSAVHNLSNLIISGDIARSALKDKLLDIKYTSEVYYSPLEGKNLPEIKKYHGVVLSGDYKGVTQLI